MKILQLYVVISMLIITLDKRLLFTLKTHTVDLLKLRERKQNLPIDVRAHQSHTAAQIHNRWQSCLTYPWNIYADIQVYKEIY